MCVHACVRASVCVYLCISVCLCVHRVEGAKLWVGEKWGET